MRAAGNWRQRPLPGFDQGRLRSWLAEPGSLTARCQAACRTFRIRVLASGRGRPWPDEAAFFSLRRGQRAWTREVCLECDGVPVIFAHTVLPAHPRGRLSGWLAGLGSRSLGSLLFACPGFERAPIECLRLDRRHPLFRRARAVLGLSGVSELWARRSEHRLGAQSVLVTEVFLSAIEALERDSRR